MGWDLTVSNRHNTATNMLLSLRRTLQRSALSIPSQTGLLYLVTKLASRWESWLARFKTTGNVQTQG